MTADDWKLLTIILGVPIALLTIWLAIVKILKPLYKEWNREVWKEEMARWDEGHRVALAARDTGVAYMASAQAQGAALTEAIRALAAAHDTAMAFGELRQTMGEFKLEVENKFDEQDDALEEIRQTLSDIRGFMRGAGMDRRTTDQGGP